MGPSPKGKVKDRGGRVPSPSSEPEERWLVAIGASAGGLKALGRLLKGLPADFKAPILAVIHLDPRHESKLAQLLQKETRLTVVEAEAGQLLEPGHVYIAPPDRHLEVRGNRLTLGGGARVRFSRPSIDRLFETAAVASQERTIGVLLSGSGNDGAVGAKAIKDQGGRVIVQSSKTAEFRSMVDNALRQGVVDLELPVDRIGAALVRSVRSKPGKDLGRQWDAVLSLLRDRFGTDFRGYRSTTLRRRLERRVVASGQKDLGSYLAFVQRKPEELERLHSEFLIKVSAFFRDEKEWDQLARNVVRPLVEGPGRAREIRVWSVGCSTGQEPYSLAVLFAEAARGRPGLRVKIFATDLDEDALATARLGEYPAEQFAGMPPVLRNRYFVQDGPMWRATKSLRSYVVFGRHDILRDPPLPLMDLVSCRNVLIYFTPEQSRLALQRIQYSIKPGGFLFLGRSEAGRHRAKTFSRVPGTARIFMRTADTAPRDLPLPPTPRLSAMPPKAELPSHKREAADEIAFRNLLLDTATVMLFGIDQESRVMLWNKAAESFFGVPAGLAVGQTLSDVVGQQFWQAITALVKDVASVRRSLHFPRVPLQRQGGQTRVVDVDCTPMKAGEGSGGGLLFAAVDMTERYLAEAQQSDLIEQLGKTASDARRTNNDLETANEELETLNEELQSTSEEQQTLNEELESRNEELETVNEELQSLNQELNTLNDEVGARIAEAHRATAYLQTLLNLSPDALVGCDLAHRVTFWNTAATKRFRLSERQALGQRLYDLVPALDALPVRKLTGGKKGEGSVVLSRKFTQSGAWEVEVLMVRDEGGRFQGYVLRVGDAPDPARERSAGKARRAKT